MTTFTENGITKLANGRITYTEMHSEKVFKVKLKKCNLKTLNGLTLNKFKKHLNCNYFQL